MQTVQLTSIFALFYIGVIFLITNFLSKKTAKKYYSKWWMKRRVVIPVGIVISVIIIFLCAYLLPDDLLFFVAGPFICYYVGLVANISFLRVEGYRDLAEKHNPYSKTNRKK